MDWEKPRDWQNLITKFLAKGNTDKEEEKIKKKNAPKKNGETKKDNLSDDAIDQIVDKLAKKLGKQEAYTEERFTRLEKLLEEAEGE